MTSAKWKKLIAITKDLEAEYSTLFQAGLIDDLTLHDNLTGIGLQTDVANAVAAKAEARANATLQRRTIADARALARATAAEERRAAVKGFTTGTIGEAALLAALVATGLTPVQAAAWTELAALTKGGNLRWIYGLQLAPAEATLLRERVAALTDQRKRLHITDPEYHDALAALKIPDNWINAMRAAADAMITPAKSAFAIPVQTTS